MAVGTVLLFNPSSTDVTDLVDQERSYLETQANRLNDIFDCVMRDESLNTGGTLTPVREWMEVIVQSDGTRIFGGAIAHLEPSLDGLAVEYHLRVVGFDAYLDRRVIQNGARTGSRYDNDDVNWILTFAGDLGITGTTFVSRLRTQPLPDIDYSGLTVRQALDKLAGYCVGPVYWVDANKAFHWIDPQSDQIVVNPDMESGSVGWNLVAGHSAYLVDGGPGGTGDTALQTTGDGTANLWESTQVIAGIVGNRRYFVFADMWSSVASSARCRFDWLDGTGTRIRVDAMPNSGAASTWNRFNLILTAPAGATQLKVWIGGAANGWTGTVRHDNVNVVAETATWGVSTTPNGTTERRLINWKEPRDATQPVNKVLIIGNGISGWRTNAASIAYFGKTFEGVSQDQNITTADGIDSRAAAVFRQYAFPAHSGTYDTYDTGLLAGSYQIVRVEPLSRISIEYITTLRTIFDGAGSLLTTVTYGEPPEDVGSALAGIQFLAMGGGTANLGAPGSDSVPPAVPTGLALVTGTTYAPDGTLRPYILATWNPNTDADFQTYEVQVDRDLNNVSVTFSQPFDTRVSSVSYYSDNVLGGVLYGLRIRAIDFSGNASAWAPAQTIVAAQDTMAPAIPVGLVAIPGFQLIGLQWQPDGDTDLLTYQVRWTSDDPAGVEPAWTVVTASASYKIVNNLVASTVYSFEVRAIDRSGNCQNSSIDSTAVNANANPEAGWCGFVQATPTLVNGSSDIAANSITADRISVVGLDASVIRSGTLSIGGTSDAPGSFQILDSTNRKIGQWDANGLYLYDPTDATQIVRVVNGVLSFSSDSGATYETALDANGVRADAILLGTLPGGHNSIPNSSFELAAFTTPVTKVWTAAGDFTTTIGTDVNVTKTGTELVLTAYTF